MKFDTIKRVRTPFAVALVFAIGLTMGTVMVRYSQADSATYDNLKIFSEVLSLVQKNYVEPVESKDLVYGAIKGMLNDLDPHSSFMTPDMYKEMQVDTKGEFGGLGIQIAIKDRTLTVISPIEDTPAYRIGIKAGDKIVMIEGEPTKDMTLTQAVDKMRGPKGTSVTISIMREGLDKPKDFTITRDIIKIKSVKSKVIDDEIGYIRISQFQEKTMSELKDAMADMKEANIRSLILDLRNDPGGLLNMAVDVSGMFLPSGKLVVYIKGRNGEKDEFFTRDKEPETGLPMVVLVNEGSASASEIVAGALQDWGRAVIMGARTFGKGSVQTVIGLSDGSGLRLTTARYYTPKDRSIQNTGIEPDINVKQQILVADSSGAAVSPHTIREKDLDRHLGNDTIDESAAPENNGAAEEPAIGDADIEAPPIGFAELGGDDDYQLQRAKDLLKGISILKELPAPKTQG